jgi:hypothetical protein
MMKDAPINLPPHFFATWQPECGAQVARAHAENLMEQLEASEQRVAALEAELAATKKDADHQCRQRCYEFERANKLEAQIKAAHGQAPEPNAQEE